MSESVLVIGGTGMLGAPTTTLEQWCRARAGGAASDRAVAEG